MAVASILVATVAVENVLLEIKVVARMFVNTVTVESLLIGAVAGF